MTKKKVLPISGVSSSNGAEGQETTISVLPIPSVSPDSRPDPKPRKHARLWQSYLWWYEVMEMRKRHLLRISSIEKGKSNLDLVFEKNTLEQLEVDAMVEVLKETMVNHGQTVGPIWDWITSIKGLGEGGLAAQLLAQIDDIHKFDSVSALWRFAGFAVVNGKAEKNEKGKKAKFNGKLKGICFNIADQFIKQKTPGYVDLYYAEKERLRDLHPDALCEDCGLPAERYQKKVQGEYVPAYRCPERIKEHKIRYGDAHIHNRAWRRMVKEFLKDVYNEWKRA